MKDIKSMIIGFLLATCMFLFMGWNNNPNHIKAEFVEAETVLADFIMIGDNDTETNHMVSISGGRIEIVRKNDRYNNTEFY